MMYYDIEQATKLCGYKKYPSMINYLCRIGLIYPSEEVPRGRGKKRQFSFKDLLILKIYRKMFDAGLSVYKLKSALEESEIFKSLIATKTDLRYKNSHVEYLVQAGDNVYLCLDKDHAIQIGASGQYAFSFMLNVKGLYTELANDVIPIEQEQLKKAKNRSGYVSVQKRRA